MINLDTKINDISDEYIDITVAAWNGNNICYTICPVGKDKMSSEHFGTIRLHILRSLVDIFSKNKIFGKNTVETIARYVDFDNAKIKYDENAETILQVGIPLINADNEVFSEVLMTVKRSNDG